jgi:hypothetical protein
VKFNAIVSNTALSAHEKLVLLVLSNKARPVSVSTLKTLTSLSRSAVIRVISGLKTSGYLEAETTPGGCNSYKISTIPHPVASVTQPLVSHSYPCHTATRVTQTLVESKQPATICKSLKDLKDNINTKDKNKTKDNNTRTPARKTALDMANKPANLSNSGAENLIAYRREIKKPLTQRSLDAIFRQLEAAAEAGWEPDDAVEHMLTSGWRGLRAEWLINSKQDRGKNETNQRLSLVERVSAAADDIRRKIASGEISDNLNLPVGANGRDLW